MSLLPFIGCENAETSDAYVRDHFRATTESIQAQEAAAAFANLASRSYFADVVARASAASQCINMESRSRVEASLMFSEREMEGLYKRVQCTTSVLVDGTVLEYSLRSRRWLHPRTWEPFTVQKTCVGL